MVVNLYIYKHFAAERLNKMNLSCLIREAGAHFMAAGKIEHMWNGIGEWRA